MPDRISTDAGILDWASRLLTLNSPVKRHTMDYMMHYLLRDEDGSSRFYKIYTDVPQDWDVEFYLRTGSREQVLQEKSQELIFQYMWTINNVLNDIVLDSFTCSGPLLS
jgi:hypothetical protein